MNFRQYRKWFTDTCPTNKNFRHCQRVAEHLKPDLEVLKMFMSYQHFNTMFEDFFKGWRAWYFEVEVEHVMCIQLGVSGVG